MSTRISAPRRTDRTAINLGLALVAMLAACHRPPAAPPAPVAAPAPPPAPQVPCPLVPVSLVMTPPSGAPRTLVALDANGRLDVSLVEHRTGVAKLDSQGCLVGGDGLWAEWAPHDKLWTSHEVFDVFANCLTLDDARRAICVRPDGSVFMRAKDGSTLPESLGSFSIEGYREEARCAGMVLLATFMSMMPSMAVVDGHPARAPAPDGSRCDAFRADAGR